MSIRCLHAKAWVLAFGVLGLSASVWAEDDATCTSSFYCYGSDATPAGAQAVRIVVEGEGNQGQVISPNNPPPPPRIVSRPLAPNLARSSPFQEGSHPVVLDLEPTVTSARSPQVAARQVVARPSVLDLTRSNAFQTGTRPSVLDVTDTNPNPPQVARPVMLTQAASVTSRPVVRRVAPVVANMQTQNFASLPSVLDANVRPAPPVRRVVMAPAVRTQPTPSVRRPQTRVVAAATAGTTMTISCNSLLTLAGDAESKGILLARSGQSANSRQSFQTAATLRSQAASLNCRA